MTLKLALGSVLILGVAAAGCIIAHRDGQGHLRGISVIIPHGHIHSAHCGHYHWRGGWYVLQGHVHSDGCGHRFFGGNWVSDED